MVEKLERILLVDHSKSWAERFVNTLQVRGWNIFWTMETQTIFEQSLFSVYLINLSHPSVDPKNICNYIRRLPKGENVSIFLLNDGEAALKSFEEALSLGADGLYFHKSQLPLLLTNFPPKHTSASGHVSKSEGSPTLSSRHFGAGITLGGGKREQSSHVATPSVEKHDNVRMIHHRDRVTSMSLNYRNRQRLSQGYTSDPGLSVSAIESALAAADDQAVMGTNIYIAPLSHQPPMINVNSAMDDQFISLSVTPKAEQHLNLDQADSSIRLSTSYMPSRPTMIDEEVTPVPSLPWGSRFQISDIPFAQCFGKIIAHRLSLRVLIEDKTEHQTHKHWVELVISEGDIVCVRSNDLVLSFAQHLIAQGLISQRDAELILVEVYKQSDSTTHLDCLIEAVIDFAPQIVARLDSIMEITLIKIIYRLFELIAGEVSLFAYNRPDEIRRFQVSSSRLLIDGIKESMGKLRLYSLFGTPKVIPLLDRVGLYTSSLTEAELNVVQGAQGHRSVNELSINSGLSKMDTLGLCYAFSLLGDLTLNEQSPLTSFYQRACGQDYYQLLSLDYHASNEEITEAWRSHRQWLAEQKGDPELVSPLIDILNDAYCVLAHPPLRVRYLDSLEKPIYSEMSIVPESYTPVSHTQTPEHVSRSVD